MNAKEILNLLTLKEKTALLSGKDFWHTKNVKKAGLSEIMMCDGPHGLRCQKGKADMLGINNSVPATCFPTASVTACSWDEVLLYEVGGAIADEAAANGVSVVLGPGANIKRDPLCGRNFEYFSEDPYLSGKLASAWIRGAQNRGIGTSLKHFALNNQEYKRFNGSSDVDERTMRELYLRSFEIAVKEAKPRTVMCSYNKINGEHASDHRWLLTDVLRKEWGFQGLVVTDWGGMHDKIKAIRAGCDLNMPGGSDYMERDVLNAVKAGMLDEIEVDACTLRVIELLLENQNPHDTVSVSDKNHELSKRVAVESAVLLKNESGILPLSEGADIAIIGSMADQPRYQGAGSSHINPTRLDCARNVLKGKYAPGYRADGATDDVLIGEAVNAARESEIAVVFAGLPDSYESEGFDRANMRMPEGHLRLIEEVAEANPNTIVVLMCGSAVECPWADHVKAILYMGLSGQGGGKAVYDLLYGKATPCGKLAESWPYVYEDAPTSAYYRGTKNPRYYEGLYVGYRYYDTAEVNVRWPFGYGLSYTTFAYSDLQLIGNEAVFTIQNTGSAGGSEIAQVYIAPKTNGIYRPKKELKGFKKVYLAPGESKTVRIGMDEHAFSVWNDGWNTEEGEYEVQICASVSDVRLSKTVIQKGRAVTVPHWQKESWYDNPKGLPKEDDWLRMYGKKPTEELIRKGSFTMDHTILEMKPHSLAMRLMYKLIEYVIAMPYGGKKDYSKPEFRMMIASSTDSPLRNIQICAGLKRGLAKGLLSFANGRIWQGILLMIGIKK